MAKYELIPPPIDPLGSYRRENKHTGVPVQLKGQNIGIFKARMVTPRLRGDIGHPAPNDESMLIPPHTVIPSDLT